MSSIFRQTVKNMIKLLKTHFTNWVFYSLVRAILEISQPILRKACLNKGVFSEVGCGRFGWELNEPEFRWLDLILPFLVSSIKSTQMFERMGGHSAERFLFQNRKVVASKNFWKGRDLNRRLEIPFCN